MQSQLLDRLGDDERGTGFGLVRTVYIGFAALSGVAVGGVATLAGWGASLAVLAGALALPALAPAAVAVHGGDRASGR